jgi:hypothetical protein
MSRRYSLCLALLLGLAASAEAAPAPFAHPATTEAVLVTGTAKRGKAVSQRLLAADFLDRVLRSDRLRGLACLSGVTDRQAWLKARVKVELLRGGALARITLSGCTDREGLPLLQAVVDGLTAKPAQANDRIAMLVKEREMRKAVLLAVKQQGGRVVIRGEDDVLARYDIESNPPIVKQAPRRARRGQ